MVLSTEWSQVEVIDLVNDGSGLGFGIVGGRSTGVVIKSILPGGIADKDGRLQSGDHILQIGEVNLRGLAADQVASVLRQAGPQVRMVVARPIEPSSADFQTLGCSAPIVPTKILTDPEELDRTLLQNGYTQICNYTESEIEAECGQISIEINEIDCETVTGQCRKNIVKNEDNLNKSSLNNPSNVIEASVIPEDSLLTIEKIDDVNSSENLNETDLNKLNDIKTNSEEVNQNCNGTNRSPIETNRNSNEKVENSEADHTKIEESQSVPNLDTNFDIIDKCSKSNCKESKSADELSNNIPECSEFARELSNGSLLGPQFFTPTEIEYESEQYSVTLHKNEFGLGITVAGYVCEREDLSGIFVKSLNEGSEAFQCGLIEVNDRIVKVDGESLENVSNHEAVEKLKRSGSTVTLTFERYLSGPKFEQLLEALASCNLNDQRDISPASPSVTTLSWIPIEDKADKESDASSLIDDPQEKEIFIEEDFEANPEDDLETAIKKKWENIIGPGADIVVANLTKLKGLGISLEGTVDVEGGVELRPHHYIRSILPEGPVGQNGKLSSGDELLEVNGQKLLGIKHVEVVKLLKELPNTVRLVCARTQSNRVINTSQDREAFEQRNILGGSLKNLLPQPEQKLLKAMSDTSINTSSSVTVTDDTNPAPNSDKSKSLTNIAMWCEDPIDVDLVKGDRGLGFSILDYQDPVDEQSTIIVIRSVIPNGVAEKDGRISPGDRLVSVNGQTVKNFTLDQAVQALKCTPIGAVVKLKIAKPLKSSTSTSR